MGVITSICISKSLFLGIVPRPNPADYRTHGTNGTEP